MLRFTSQLINNNLFKVSLSKENQMIGLVNIGFPKNSDAAILYHLNIKPLYQGKNYGSSLLHYIENEMKYKYNISKIKVLAHQEPLSDLTQFYQKNGYSIVDNNESNKINNDPLKYDSSSLYDNNYIVYDLISMEKKI